MNDQYIVALSKVLVSLEACYGLKGNGRDSRSLSMLEVKAIIDNDLKSMSKDDIISRNEKATKDIILLSYLMQNMEFYNLAKLDFSHYVGLKECARILLRFTKNSTITTNDVKDVSRIMRMLDALEKKQANIKNGLAYRYLRMFVILVMNNSLCNASIVATLILKQFIVR